MKRYLLAALGTLLLAPTVSAIIDSNNNGLSDLWERAYNDDELFAETFGPQADEDFDGWTNAQEAAAGTDPFDPNPPDGLVRPETAHIPAVYEPDENGVPKLKTPEAVTVTWPTLVGKQYTLLFSPDLSSESWFQVGNPYIGNGNDFVYGFPNEDVDSRFWRVAVSDVDTDGDGLTDSEEHTLGSSRYLKDTDGDGIDDAAAYAAGTNPAGDGTDADGDGVPDNELYSVVFETQHESHTMPFGVGFDSFDSNDTTHRYLTYKDTDKYSVTGSPNYPDVTDGEHVVTSTHLVNGAIPGDGQPVSSAQGTTFSDWKSNHGTALGEGETLHEGETVTTVDGPTATATEIKTVTTETTPWTIKKNGNVIRSGTEVITVTEQNNLSDETTYPQFWNNHVKSRAWEDSPSTEYGPLNWVEYNRACIGDAAAAEFVRDYFRNHDFEIFGNISAPGASPPDYGSDQRLKSFRWRWVKFNPHSPFGYEYATPPVSLHKTFHLLVSQRDYLDARSNSGYDPLVDVTATKGIVEIECAAGEGTTYWQTVPLTKFASHKIEDPVHLADIDFLKWGYTQVWFRNQPVEFLPLSETIVSADDHQATIVLSIANTSSDPDGSIVEWQIESGDGGSLTETETIVRDGLTVASLNTSTTKGEEYRLKARIKQFGLNDNDISASSAWLVSPLIRVSAGVPHSFQFTASKSSYRSDGTDTTEITAEIRDQYGNLVDDGTLVDWGVGQNPPPPFVSEENVTVSGLAKAVLRAPLIPDDQIVSCYSGDKEDTTTIAVESVTGSVSGDLNLNIGGCQQSTITVNAQAADGTPVYWTSSNGKITTQSTIASGTATATLDASNGRLGAVVVTATVGDRLLYKEGAFTSLSGLAIGADHPVLISNATADGVHSPTFANGITRDIPFYATTPVRLKGPANGLAHLTVQASVPVASWAFDTVNGNVTPSGFGLHGMTLTNAIIEEDVQQPGVGSLLLAGTGSGSVPDSIDFHFTDQFNATAWLRPTQYSLATLASKTGSWEILQLADGRVQANITTESGNYSSTTVDPVALNRWTALEVDFRFNRIQILLDNLIQSVTATTGTIVVTTAPVDVGNGFIGNLDGLTIRGAGNSGTYVSVTGLDTDSTLRLDSNGEGHFTVTSTGLAAGGTAIRIFSKVNPEAETKVVLTDPDWWDYTCDTVASFFGGDPATNVGTASSIAGGFLVVGDIGSCTKNLWRMAGWSDKKPNYVELSLGGIGILTTFAELTGVGAPVDAGFAALKTLAMRFGTNADGIKFLTVFIEQIKNAIRGVGNFGWAEANFLGKMVSDIPVADAFRLFLHDDSLAKAAVRAFEKLGANAESFYQGVRRAVATHGAEAAKKFVSAFDGLGDEALDSLKNAPAGQLDEALDGLAKVVNKGIDPVTIKIALDNTHLFGTQYKRVNLLKDLGELANVKGLDEAAAMLKAVNAQAKGFRYEIEGAAWLARNGKEVVELTKRVAVVLEEGADVVRTDIDIVILEAGKRIYYQLKRSRSAFVGGTRNIDEALGKTQAWVAKAFKDLGDGATHEQIRYATDAAVTVPQKILDWFGSLNPNIIVEIIPHLD